MDRKEAEKFVDDWLWYSPKRKTDSMGWPQPYKLDAVSITIDAYEKGFQDGETKQAILEIQGRDRFIKRLKKEKKDE